MLANVKKDMTLKRKSFDHKPEQDTTNLSKFYELRRINHYLCRLLLIGKKLINILFDLSLYYNKVNHEN